MGHWMPTADTCPWLVEMFSQWTGRHHQRRCRTNKTRNEGKDAKKWKQKKPSRIRRNPTPSYRTAKKKTWESSRLWVQRRGVLWRDLVLLSKCVASPNTVGKRIVDPLQFNWRQSLSLIRDWGVNVSEECWMGELMMTEPQRWCTYGSDTVLINLNAQVRLYVRCMQCTYREALEFPRYYHREFDIFPSFGRVLGPYFPTTRHSQKSWDLGRHSAPYFQPWWEEKEKDRDKEREWESEITRSLREDSWAGTGHIWRLPINNKTHTRTRVSIISYDTNVHPQFRQRPGDDGDDDGACPYTTQCTPQSTTKRRLSSSLSIFSSQTND